MRRWVLRRPFKIWRLQSTAYQDAAFNGEGAAFGGGRWNHRDVPAVYCSTSLALAAFEVLVHVNRTRQKLPPLSAFHALLPKGAVLHVLRARDLPSPDWRSYNPSPRELAVIGTDWLKAGHGLGLVVPSAALPAARNVILNPAHPQMCDVRTSRPRPFEWDRRLRHP